MQIDTCALILVSVCDRYLSVAVLVCIRILILLRRDDLAVHSLRELDSCTLLNNKEMALLQGVEKGIPISKSAKDYLDEAGKLRGLQYEVSVVMDDNSKLREMSPLIENADIISAFNEAANLVLYDKAAPEKAAKQLYDTCAEHFDMARVS